MHVYGYFLYIMYKTNTINGRTRTVAIRRRVYVGVRRSFACYYNIIIVTRVRRRECRSIKIFPVVVNARRSVFVLRVHARPSNTAPVQAAGYTARSSGVCLGFRTSGREGSGEGIRVDSEVTDPARDPCPSPLRCAIS